MFACFLHRPIDLATHKCILLLREIDSEMESGKFTSARMYTHI